jgi:Icc protein
LNPDLVLVTGDLCQDESWGGYVRLRRALSQHVRCSVALLPGNHDHPLLRCGAGETLDDGSS